jgi:fatty acid desaturase
VSAFVRGHTLSHHRYTQTTRDVMRTSKARFRWNLLNQALFFFVVAKDVAGANGAYAKRMKEKGDPWFHQFQVERWTALAVVVALVLVDWRAAILFLGVPRLWANWGIVGMNYLQHDGCDEAHPYDHSRTFSGRAINWWTFNNGYHGIHHQKPHVHWSKLPATHAAEYAPHVHPALVEPSIVAYCWRAFVWPGLRLDFRGAPVVLPPAAPDEDWMPSPHDLAATSRGAVAEAYDRSPRAA